MEFGEDAAVLLNRESDPLWAITVPEALENPHKWVKKSAGKLRRNSTAQAEIRKTHPCLDVTASRPALDRALLIADTLLKAFEARGFRVEVTEPAANPEKNYRQETSRTGVHILGTFIEFGLEEGFDSVKFQPKAVVKTTNVTSRAWRYTPQPEYKRVPNGKLALKLKSHLSGTSRVTWADGKKQKV